MKLWKSAFAILLGLAISMLNLSYAEIQSAPNKDFKIRELHDLAKKAFRLPDEDIIESSIVANVMKFRTTNLTISKRLDSRTFFVDDKRFAKSREPRYSNLFSGTDKELLSIAEDTLTELQIPLNETLSKKVLKVKQQAFRLDKKPTGRFEPIQPVQEVGKYVVFSRHAGGVPVFSSRLFLGVTSSGSVGSLELHWPEVPQSVIEDSQRLAKQIKEGWKPPELKNAKVESFEVGIIHSPALGFFMDFRPVVRVIYRGADENFGGKKPVLYVDGSGKPISMPRSITPSGLHKDTHRQLPVVDIPPVAYDWFWWLKYPYIIPEIIFVLLLSYAFYPRRPQ